MNALIPLGLLGIVAILCIGMCCFKRKRNPDLEQPILNNAPLEDNSQHLIPVPSNPKEIPLNISFKQEEFPSVTNEVTSYYEMNE